MRPARRFAMNSAFSFLLLSTWTPSIYAAPSPPGGASNVTCITETWSLNSLGQTPCLVGADLGAACSPIGIPPLDAPNTYFPSNPPSACECSTVFYALISACSLCQGNPTITTWNLFSVNCTKTSLASFPQAIPPGTSVPQWAYQDISGNQVFNETSAIITGDQPESSAGSAAPTQTKPPATSQSLITSQISTSGFGGPSSSSTSPSSKSVNIGAIVGGVVGGIAGLTAIVVLILFLMRKRRAPVLVTPARPPLPEKAGGLQSYDSTIKKNNSQSRRQVAFQSRRGPSRQRSTPGSDTMSSNGRSNASSPPAMSPTSARSGGPAALPDYMRPAGYTGAAEL
ncbi:hypothetical protein SISSUDRAFT_26429 [Sistotremastrum suecicum HHB10207 ss-3]|uniref:Mid2 domain-containing protein n=1 Tax=Sistotremastrum suecicum HHB10207 ss-3 TaxID=1314776 RepID=A0A166JA50_9AGAM|nr:hypothetical protein SISSUDRAFT_26429 [Sistotremastrum suecicum HHB10207 ss-3]